MGLEREVTGVEELHFSVRVVALEGVCARGQEERIVLTPHGEQRRPLGTEVFLELGIERDVVRVVEEQIQLNLPGRASRAESST